MKNKLLYIFILFFFIPSISNAAIVTFTGIESGAPFGEAGSGTASGTFNVSIDPVYSGTYALRINPTGAAGGQISPGVPDAAGNQGSFNIATGWLTFYFRYATKATVGNEEILRSRTGGGTEKFTLRLASSGELVMYAGTTPLATSSAVLSADTWYKLYVKMGTGASAAYELYVDDVSQFSGTASVSTTNTAQFNFGKTNNRNSNSVDYFYDNIIVDDSQYHTSSDIKALKPNANGSTMQWTGGTNASDYQEVDETPHDSDTTYIRSTALNDVALFDLTSTSEEGITGTILAVKGFAVVRDEGTVSGAQLRIRSGSSNSDSTSRDPGNVFFTSSGITSVFVRLLTTDPATSAAWTLSALDDVEVGVIESVDNRLRATQVVLSVLYVPAAAAAEGDEYIMIFD